MNIKQYLTKKNIFKLLAIFLFIIIYSVVWAIFSSSFCRFNGCPSGTSLIAIPFRNNCNCVPERTAQLVNFGSFYGSLAFFTWLFYVLISRKKK
jgi:hypothetical protein